MAVSALTSLAVRFALTMPVPAIAATRFAAFPRRSCAAAIAERRAAV